MATKKSKAAPTGDELFAQLDELGGETNDPVKKPVPKPSSSTTKVIRHGSTPSQTQEEADLLAELDNLAQQPDRPKSRPHTPRTTSAAIPPAQPSPKRTSTSTPPTTATTATSGVSRSSEEKVPVQSRKSGESTRSFHQGFTPDDEEGSTTQNQQEAGKETTNGTTTAMQSGGSWWGGIVATASAAVKQAEALAKEIQRNEEAQRWAEQVKGNVGALRSYGKFMAQMLVLRGRNGHHHALQRMLNGCYTLVLMWASGVYD